MRLKRIVIMSLAVINVCALLNIPTYANKPVANDRKESTYSLEQLEDNISIWYNDPEISKQVQSIEQFSVKHYVKIQNAEEDNLLNRYAIIASTRIEGEGSSTIKMEDGEYKYKYSDWKTVTRSHLAGNQPASKGYRFPTGGGFYYSNQGGPSVDVSVVIGAPFENVDFSISFGNRSSGVTGLFINVPSKKYYYKLAVKKTYRVRSYIIYRRQTSNSRWYKYSGGSQKDLTNQAQWAKRIE